MAIFLAYYLISNPSVYLKLRHELEAIFPSFTLDTQLPDTQLSRLPYLDAAITESIRLGSPFVGFPRTVPKGGSIIDGVFVPEGTIVGVPTHAQAIAKENFWPEPLEFRPERWMPGGLGPGSYAKKGAILSFSFGKQFHMSVAPVHALSLSSTCTSFYRTLWVSGESAGYARVEGVSSSTGTHLRC